MAFVDALLHVGASAMQGSLTHASLHSADPGGTGANQIGTRQAITWGTPANGDFGSFTCPKFTGMTPGTPITHIGFWNASTAGTWWGSYAAVGSTSVDAAGECTITSGSVAGTST